MSGGRAKKERVRKPKRPMPPGREAVKPRPTPKVALAESSAGRAIVRSSWAGTALLAVTTVIAAIDPHDLAVPALVVALAEFFGGTGVFIWAYLVAVGRSRAEELTATGVFGLSGSTPREVQVQLFGSLAVEIVLAVGGFAAQPRSSLAFGILACMWGLGVAGLWGAKHGAFPLRVERRRVGRRGGSATTGERSR
jgi:hypothetical protein